MFSRKTAALCLIVIILLPISLAVQDQNIIAPKAKAVYAVPIPIKERPIISIGTPIKEEKINVWRSPEKTAEKRTSSSVVGTDAIFDVPPMEPIKKGEYLGPVTTDTNYFRPVPDTGTDYSKLDYNYDGTAVIQEDFPEKWWPPEKIDINNSSSSGVVTIQGDGDNGSTNTCTSNSTTDLWNTHYPGSIDYAGDVDWFKGNRSGTNTLRFIMIPPIGKDYDMAIYDSCAGSLVKQCNAGLSGAMESCTATVTGDFYVKVYGYNNSYSATAPYRLTARGSGTCDLAIGAGTPSKNSYSCNESITVNGMKVYNNNPLVLAQPTIAYSLYDELYTPNQNYYAWTATQNLTYISPGTPINQPGGTFNPPTQGGWPDSGNYTERAYALGWCNRDWVDVQAAIATARPSVSCAAGSIIGSNGTPEKNSFACSEDIVTLDHDFENTSNTYSFNYTFYYQLIDPNNNVINSFNIPNKNIDPGTIRQWEIPFSAPTGGWLKSGTYTVKTWVEGTFSDGRNPGKVYSYAYPYVPTAPCPNCNLQFDNGEPTKSSFKSYETIDTENHDLTNNGNLNFNYGIRYQLFDSGGNEVGSGSSSNNTLEPGYIFPHGFLQEAPNMGWKTGGYTAKLTASGTCSDGTPKTLYSYAYPVVEETCSIVSGSTQVTQDNMCRETIVTEHSFLNNGTRQLPYNISFYLYDPSGNLVDQAARADSITPKYVDTWTVTWYVPSEGWKPGAYRAEARISGNCNGGASSSASNSASPTIPQSCGATSCSGTINVNVSDNYSSGIGNAKVYLDGTNTATTNSSGNAPLPTTDASCGKSHSIAIYCENGTYCGTKSTTIDSSGDNDQLNFSCQVCAQNKNLSVTVSGGGSYSLNDTVTLDISVNDGLGNTTDATLSITDPFKGSNAQGTATNGKYTYTTTATKTGTQTFTITASKNGYNAATTSKTISITPKTGNIIVGVNNPKGTPIQNAKIYLDNTYSGETDSSGRKSIPTRNGSHSVKVYCQNNSYCTEKNINLDGIATANFECGCTGNFRAATETAEGYAMQNVYLYLDGAQVGVTNSFGFTDLSNIAYGSHQIKVYLNIADSQDEEPTIHYGTKTIEFSKDFDEITFVLVPKNDLTPKQSYAENKTLMEITKADKNVSTTAVLVPIAVAVVVVGLFVWDYGTFSQCVTQNQDFWGATGQLTWDSFRCNRPEFSLYQDAKECTQKMKAIRQRAFDECKLQAGFVVLNFIPGGRVIGIGGKLAIKGAKEALHIIPHIDDAYRVLLIEEKAAMIVTVVKNGKQTAYELIGDTLKLAKGKVFIIADIAKRATVTKLIKERIDIALKINDRTDKDYLEKAARKLVDTVPGSIRESPQGVRGFLGEKAADEYLNIVKEELEKEGATVEIVKGLPGEIVKGTDSSADYVFKYGSGNDKAAAEGISIYSKATEKQIGQIDRLLKVNGRFVVVQVKAGLYDGIFKGGEALKSSDIIANYIKPLNQLAPDTEFILLAAKEETKDIAEHQGAKALIKELNEKGVEATAENMPVLENELYLLAGKISRIAKGGAG